MKKYNLLLLLFAFMFSSAFADIKVGQNGVYTVSTTLRNAVAKVRQNQDAGTLGDTIFLSGIIDIATDLEVIGSIAPGDDKPISRYTYTIVGEGSDNTILQGATVAEGETNIGTKFLYFGCTDPAKSPIVYMEGFAIQGFSLPAGTGLISLIDGTTAKLKDVKITDSSSPNYLVICEDADSVTMEDCMFKDLEAGTAIVAIMGDVLATVWGPNANKYVLNNTTFENANGASLGAIYSLNVALLKLDGCVVKACSGKKVIDYFTNPNSGTHHTDFILNNCAIVDNVTTLDGTAGVVYLWDGNNATSTIDATITGCVFYGNKAAKSGSCAFFNSPKKNISVKMYNNTIANNIEKEIASGGAIYCHHDISLEMKNNVVYGTVDPLGAMCRDFKTRLAMTDIVLSNNILENIHDASDAKIDLTGNYSNSFRNATAEFDIDMPATYDENYQMIPLSTSTAIDNGVVIADYTVDFNGTAPDMGAYESPEDLTVSVPSATASAVTISPVPAQSTLYINSSQTMEWQLYSVSGSLLSSGNGNQVDVSSLDAGSYFIMMTDDKGQTIVKQFLK